VLSPFNVRYGRPMVKRRNLRVAGVLLVLLTIVAMIGLRGSGGDEQNGESAGQIARAQAALRARMRAFQGAALNVQKPPTKEVWLAGVVTSSAGVPLENASVCAACARCDSTVPGTRPRCVQTGADGRYVLRALPVGSYRLTASATGYLPAVLNAGQPIGIDPRGLSRSDLDAKLDEGGAVLAGIVSDVTGGPIAGATVQANVRYAEGQAVSQVTTSDEAGGFSISVASGPVLLVASAEGYAPSEVTRYAPARDVRLVMTPPASIAGHVVTTTQAQPVAGAEVRAWGTAGSGFAVSDDQGAFVLQALRPGSYQVEAQGRGFRGQYTGTVVVGLLEDKRDILIAVDAARTVSGMVKLDSAPCELAEVGLQPTQPGLRPVYARGNPDGSVVIESVLPGSYLTNARCAGFGAGESKPLQVGTSDVRGVEWYVPRGLDLSVQAFNANGAAVSDLSLRLDPAQIDPNSGAGMAPRVGATDAQGRFVFAGVSEGAYLVTASGLEAPVEVQVSARRLPNTVTLKLNPVGLIDVRVTSPNGAPNDEVAVSARSSDGGPAGALAQPRGDGHYRLGPMAAGSYVVEVRDGVNPRVSTGAHEPVQVQLGRTTELQLTFGGYNGVIRGRVVARKDGPVENVWVSAEPSGTTPDGYGQMLQPTTQAEARRALTDAEGVFELKELNAQGTFTIFATGPLGGEAKLDNVRVGQDIVIPFDG
jgi:hypothetical protein